MGDSKQKRGRADRSRVSGSQRSEVDYVASKFGVSADTVRSSMRSFAISAVTALGLGLAATSNAFAAPIVPISMDSTVSHLTIVHYRGWGWGGFAAGAAAGAIIGGILAAPYYAPGPYYYPGPGYYGGYYGDAVRYCMQRFRSYDPGSGTYLGYDGYRHPCP